LGVDYAADEASGGSKIGVRRGISGRYKGDSVKKKAYPPCGRTNSRCLGGMAGSFWGGSRDKGSASLKDEGR